MKKILLLILSITISSIAANAQSAYTPIKLQSMDEYKYERSQAGKQQESYYTYSGTKRYISCNFKDSQGDLSYELRNDGRIYDYYKNYGRSGSYFVGEEMYYKCFRIYILWDDGAEMKGSLNYKETIDGRPKLTLEYPTNKYIFKPL